MNIYIKHTLNIWLIAFLVSLSACSEEFIDVPPMGLMSDANIDPVKATTASYNFLGHYDHRWNDWVFTVTGEILSDNTWKGGSSQTDQINLYNLNIFNTLPSNATVRDHWQHYYRRIGRFNWAIDAIQKVENDNSINSRLIGEVKFLRALHYFWLVRMFGDVPLVTKPLLPHEHNLSRELEANVYAFIESELKDAINRLPVKSEYNDSNLGRATKGAAQGLLAKVYMYQEKWQEAYNAAEAVINSGEYQLEPDFADVFTQEKEHGVESLFEISFPVNPERSNPTYWAISQRSRNGGFGGWGVNLPTKDLLDAFEEGDPRIIHTFVFHGDSTKTFVGAKVAIDNRSTTDHSDGFTNRKAFKPLTEIQNPDFHSANDAENIRILRYSEVLLIYAEAANELNKTQDALNKLNMVRQRARNSSTTDPDRFYINYELGNPAVRVPDITETNKEELRKIIWNERRRELALEGDRFYDLVRQGRAGQVLRAFAAKYNTDKGKGFVDGKHEKFPVPQEEIDLSKGLITQNENY